MKKVLDMDSAKKRLDIWKTAIVMELIIASIVLCLQGWKAYDSYSYYKYRENQVHEQEEKKENEKKYNFNTYYNRFSGETRGSSLELIFSGLYLHYRGSTQKEYGYPDMTLNYIDEKNENKEYLINEEKSNEITKIKNELDISNSHKYNVSFKYNENGYVNYIEISYNN